MSCETDGVVTRFTSSLQNVEINDRDKTQSIDGTGTRYRSVLTSRKLTHVDFSSLLEQMVEQKYPPPCVMGDESIMSPKAHGTSA